MNTCSRARKREARDLCPAFFSSESAPGLQSCCAALLTVAPLPPKCRQVHLQVQVLPLAATEGFS
ncbi:hypothetical protein GH733_004135 [Mirounga leonina]|nr:hypothetical protein GH733_004135 [Mirounga leonina]